MNSKIKIKNAAEVCQIDIEGTIGVPEEWQFNDPNERIATYEKFRESVQRIAQIDSKEIVVNIRSTGGDVNDALLIHDALRQTKAQITTRCFGYTASAATIIAQAASDQKRLISPNALYLIHSSVCSSEGNALELESKVDLLRKTDRRLAEIYAQRSGLPIEKFEALMAENSGKGRWLSPEEVLEYGLADACLTTDEAPVPQPPTSQTSDREKPAVRSIVRPLTRGWERLLRVLGLSPTEAGKSQSEPRKEPTIDPSKGYAQLLSQIEFEENRKQHAPTTTSTIEDPSFADTVRSSNDEAYARDVQLFHR